MRLTGEQLVDRVGHLVGVGKELFVVRQVGRIGQSPGGTYQLDVQSLAQLVGALGPDAVVCRLLPQPFDVFGAERLVTLLRAVAQKVGVVDLLPSAGRMIFST